MSSTPAFIFMRTQAATAKFNLPRCFTGYFVLNDLKYGWSTGLVLPFHNYFDKDCHLNQCKRRKIGGDTLRLTASNFRRGEGGVSRLSLRGTGVVLHDPHSMRTHSAFEVDAMFVRFRYRHWCKMANDCYKTVEIIFKWIFPGVFKFDNRWRSTYIEWRNFIHWWCIHEKCGILMDTK